MLSADVLAGVPTHVDGPDPLTPGSHQALAGQEAVNLSAGVALLGSSTLSGEPSLATAGGELPFSSLALTGAGDVMSRMPQMFAAAPHMAFDAATGQLTIRSDAGQHTVHTTLTADGFVDVSLDGQRHSSNPASPSFDRALAGTTESALTGIRYVGSSGDTLSLDSQQPAAALHLQAAGASVVLGNVVTSGPLAVLASNVTVTGVVQSSRIDVAAGVFVNSGQLHAGGANGGQIHIQANNVLNAGPISADSTAPGGTAGEVSIAFTEAYVATTGAVDSASSVAGPAGHVTIDGGDTGHLFSSGRELATGSSGGVVELVSQDVVLDAATLDASGNVGGGSVWIGSASQGESLAEPNTATVTVTSASTIRADALQKGDGGRVLVWAGQSTTFDGSVSVRGGRAGGSGGIVDLSGEGGLSYGGSADASASLGRSGTLLLDPKNITIDAAPTGGFPQFDLMDPHPTASGGFGTYLSVLGKGNVVVTNPNDNLGGAKAGAVYLFDGLSGALISALVGSHPNDQVGYDLDFNSPIVLLSNGNYLIQSPFWNGNQGAVTWASGTTGISGTLSAANSLVGSSAGDELGFVNGGTEITPLDNGNYVVASPSWSQHRGAVTWGDGSTGVRGIVSAANSLVGSNSGDNVGRVLRLTNGNYVVESSLWNGTRGAVTWGSGSAGVSGLISAANSLVGSNPGDMVGSDPSGVNTVVSLNNGNYVVGSSSWNGRRGAVTWGNGTTGTNGTVSDANSFVGTNPQDQVGEILTPLSNSNYVAASPQWNGMRGAATWFNGSMATTGSVSAANSIVGSTPGDLVGSGSFSGGVVPVSNGNFVVLSSAWNSYRGAVTWGDGTTGVTGTVSQANSLVGSTPDDRVGFSGSDAPDVTLLSNGNYVIVSGRWNGGRGAVTWVNGSTGFHGVVSAANSLVGSNPNDYVGSGPLSAGIIPLPNGNYVVVSWEWNDNRGAATWANGSTAISGTISAANSLVGSDPGDLVGSGLVTVLSSSDYVVLSESWNGRRGAATWENGSAATSGTISAANSLIGSDPGDQVSSGGVATLANGNYVVVSPTWNNEGAVTWENGRTGGTGILTAANSLVDAGFAQVTALDNGNYVVSSPAWNEQRGAVTWGNGGTGTSGVISETNSLVGSNPGDQLGYTGTAGPPILALSNGNYLVQSPIWNGHRGAVTLASSTTGQTLDGHNVVTPQNSLVGQTADAGLGAVVLDPSQQSFVAPFVTEASGRVTVGLTDPNQLRYARGQAQAMTVTPDFLTRTLDTGTSVVLQASNDITINSPITVTAGGHGGALSLEAGRSILLNASIHMDNGALTLIANDQQADGVVDSQRDMGDAVIRMAPGTSLDTGSGALSAELRDGAGRSHRESGAITLQTVTAGSATVVNNGPNPGSDVTLGSVTTSGSQYYASPHGITTVAGNLTTSGSSLTFADSVVVNGGVLVTAGTNAVSFVGNGTQTLQAGSGVRFGNVNHTAGGTLQLKGDLTVVGSFVNGAGTFDANDQAVSVASAAALLGGTYLAGTAPQTFHSGLAIVGGTLMSSTGPMAISGPVRLLGGSLRGVGTVETVTAAAGTIAPGGGNPGRLNVTGRVAFSPAANLNILLQGTEAGTGYAELRAGGPIDLGGSTLSLNIGFTPSIGSSFEIVTTTGAASINGTFRGLSEKTIFTQNGFQFEITYRGGTDGKSVALTRLA
ncbi:MAG TPA: hypothetical protein VKU02_00315 [Gemmataceae bacterium]|nr:hypothetical protein [Gemmataceae bacterium]